MTWAGQTWIIEGMNREQVEAKLDAGLELSPRELAFLFNVVCQEGIAGGWLQSRPGLADWLELFSFARQHAIFAAALQRSLLQRRGAAMVFVVLALLAERLGRLLLLLAGKLRAPRPAPELPRAAAGLNLLARLVPAPRAAWRG